MKKLLALVLAVTMLVAAFAVSASAALPNVVGTHGANHTNADGVTSPEGSASQDVNLSIGTVADRYAVDITFPAMTINLGNAVWNVNTLKYEAVGGGDVTLDNNTAETFTVTVTNYSSKAVNAEGTAPTDGQDSNFASSEIKTTVTGSGKVDAAKYGSAAGTKDLTVSVAPKSTWGESINKILDTGKEALASQTLKLSSVKVEISAFAG